MKKNLKLNKYVSLILPAVLCMSNVNNVWAQQRVVSIQIESNQAIINGEAINLDTAPYLDSYNNTMVPIRFIANAFNIPDENIKYDTLSRKITITLNGDVVNFFIGDSSLYKTKADGITTIYTMQNNSVTELVDDVIFVPIRSIAEIFDINVGWDDNTQMVTLTSESSNTTSTNITSLNDINSNITSVNDVNSNIISINELNQVQETAELIQVQEAVELIQAVELAEVPEILATVELIETTELKDAIRQYEEEVVNLINIERIKYGLQPLEIYEPAMDLAREKSQHMADNNYFDHMSPDGSYMYKQLINAFAESISVNQVTPEELVNDFINSEKDRVNILSEDFKGIGIGLADGNESSNYEKYWTQIYVIDLQTEESVETMNQDIQIQDIGILFQQTPTNYIEQNNTNDTNSVYTQPTIMLDGSSQSILNGSYMNEVASYIMQDLGQTLLTQQTQEQQTNIISTGNERASANQAINLINEERAKVGLNPLQIFEPAMSIAQERAEDMNSRNYMTTLSPEGVSLNTIISQKYGQRTSSNVANYVTNPQNAVENWMSFTPNNLLSNDYEYIGLGYSNSRWAYVLLGKVYNN